MELSKENMKKLDIYCKMTGKKAEDVVNEAIERELYYYVKSDKMPEKAIYLDGNSEYARKVAENEGRKVEITEKECYIIEKHSMFGNPYYKISVDGKIMSVPENCIKLLEGEKAE